MSDSFPSTPLQGSQLLENSKISKFPYLEATTWLELYDPVKRENDIQKEKISLLTGMNDKLSKKYKNLEENHLKQKNELYSASNLNEKLTKELKEFRLTLEANERLLIEHKSNAEKEKALRVLAEKKIEVFDSEMEEATQYKIRTEKQIINFEEKIVKNLQILEKADVDVQNLKKEKMMLKNEQKQRVAELVDNIKILNEKLNKRKHWVFNVTDGLVEGIEDILTDSTLGSELKQRIPEIYDPLELCQETYKVERNMEKLDKEKDDEKVMMAANIFLQRWVDFMWCALADTFKKKKEVDKSVSRMREEIDSMSTRCKELIDDQIATANIEKQKMEKEFNEMKEDLTSRIRQSNLAKAMMSKTLQGVRNLLKDKTTLVETLEQTLQTNLINYQKEIIPLRNRVDMHAEDHFKNRKIVELRNSVIEKKKELEKLGFTLKEAKNTVDLLKNEVSELKMKLNQQTVKAEEIEVQLGKLHERAVSDLREKHNFQLTNLQNSQTEQQRANEEQMSIIRALETKVYHVECDKAGLEGKTQMLERQIVELKEKMLNLGVVGGNKKKNQKRHSTAGNTMSSRKTIANLHTQKRLSVSKSKRKVSSKSETTNDEKLNIVNIGEDEASGEDQSDDEAHDDDETAESKEVSLNTKKSHNSKNSKISLKSEKSVRILKPKEEDIKEIGKTNSRNFENNTNKGDNRGKEGFEGEDNDLDQGSNSSEEDSLQSEDGNFSKPDLNRSSTFYDKNYDPVKVDIKKSDQAWDYLSERLIEEKRKFQFLILNLRLERKKVKDDLLKFNNVFDLAKQEMQKQVVEMSKKQLNVDIQYHLNKELSRRFGSENKEIIIKIENLKHFTDDHIINLARKLSGLKMSFFGNSLTNEMNQAVENAENWEEFEKPKTPKHLLKPKKGKKGVKEEGKEKIRKSNDKDQKYVEIENSEVLNYKRNAILIKPNKVSYSTSDENDSNSEISITPRLQEQLTATQNHELAATQNEKQSTVKQEELTATQNEFSVSQNELSATSRSTPDSSPLPTSRHVGFERKVGTSSVGVQTFGLDGSNGPPKKIKLTAPSFSNEIDRTIPSSPRNVKSTNSGNLVNKLKRDAELAESLVQIRGNANVISQPFLGYIRKHEKVYARENGLMQIALREFRRLYDTVKEQVDYLVCTTPNNSTFSPTKVAELMKKLETIQTDLSDHSWLFDPSSFIRKVGSNPLEDPVDVAAQTKIITSYQLASLDAATQNMPDEIHAGMAQLLKDLNKRAREKGGWRAVLYRVDGSMNMDMDLKPWTFREQVDIMKEKLQYLQVKQAEQTREHLKTIKKLNETILKRESQPPILSKRPSQSSLSPKRSTSGKQFFPNESSPRPEPINTEAHIDHKELNETKSRVKELESGLRAAIGMLNKLSHLAKKGELHTGPLAEHTKTHDTNQINPKPEILKNFEESQETQDFMDSNLLRKVDSADAMQLRNSETRLRPMTANAVVGEKKSDVKDKEMLNLLHGLKKKKNNFMFQSKNKEQSKLDYIPVAKTSASPHRLKTLPNLPNHLHLLKGETSAFTSEIVYMAAVQAKMTATGQVRPSSANTSFLGLGKDDKWRQLEAMKRREKVRELLAKQREEERGIIQPTEHISPEAFPLNPVSRKQERPILDELSLSSFAGEGIAAPEINLPDLSPPASPHLSAALVHAQKEHKERMKKTFFDKHDFQNPEMLNLQNSVISTKTASLLDEIDLMAVQLKAFITPQIDDESIGEENHPPHNDVEEEFKVKSEADEQLMPLLPEQLEHANIYQKLFESVLSISNEKRQSDIGKYMKTVASRYQEHLEEAKKLESVLKTLKSGGLEEGSADSLALVPEKIRKHYANPLTTVHFPQNPQQPPPKGFKTQGTTVNTTTTVTVLQEEGGMGEERKLGEEVFSDEESEFKDRVSELPGFIESSKSVLSSN